MTDDQQRFILIYRRHHAHVLAFALRRLDADRAQDVVAETFTTAWRHLNALPTPDPLPWLYRTAGHAVANERRRLTRQHRLEARMAALPGSADFADATERFVDADRVLAGLRRLSVRDQESLLLTCWEDLDIASAATAAGCSTTAMKVRLHRARRRLAQLLALDGITGSRPTPVSTHFRTSLHEERTP